MALRRSVPVLRPLVNTSSLSSALRVGRLPPPACAGRGCSFPVPSMGGGGSRRDWRVVLPAGEALQGAGVRQFGVVESVQDKIINRNIKKQEKDFKEKMEALSVKESFDLDDFAKIIEEPLDKFSAKLPWNKDRQEVQMMKTQKKVLDGLTPLQRKAPDSIRHGHRPQIAARAGVSTEDVNMTLASFREMKAMHSWLSTRRKKKEKIPETQEELQAMAADPSGTMLMRFMRVKRSKSGKSTAVF